jgi:hypothetical protein
MEEFRLKGLCFPKIKKSSFFLLFLIDFDTHDLKSEKKNWAFQVKG